MKYIYANWKMYLNYEESNSLAKEIFKKDFNKNKINIGIFPSLFVIKNILKLKNKNNIKIGVQNFDYHEKGAFTGEVSILDLKKNNCKLALVGHSERRYIFNEEEKEIKNKFKVCLENNVKPMLCIGEKKEDKKQNNTKKVLKKQLKNVLEKIDLSNKKFILAYEPVWAIANNNPCSPDEANETIIFLRKELKNYTKEKVVILYGGSVSYKNVNDYLINKDIDGVLVGSESSKKINFKKMIDQVSKL